MPGVTIERVPADQVGYTVQDLINDGIGYIVVQEDANGTYSVSGENPPLTTRSLDG